MGQNSSYRLAAGTNRACGNPVCQKLIEELPCNGRKSWRRTPRKFCSDRCKRDGYVLRRAREIIFKIGIVQFSLILENPDFRNLRVIDGGKKK
jgi:hypothetical protein